MTKRRLSPLSRSGPVLSKSRFLSGLQCEKKLWLSVHLPELASPVSAAQQRIFDTGHAVGKVAQHRFPGGQLVDAPHTEPELAVNQTLELVSGDAPALYEAAFIADSTIVRVDILQRTARGWRMVEVKSATSVKAHNVWDIAIQLYVLEQSGIHVDGAALMHLSKACVYPDLQNLFTQADLTQEARMALATIPAYLARFLEVTKVGQEPDIPIGSHCNDPFECPFKEHCWRDVPLHSIFTIPRLKKSIADEFAAEGRIALVDLPEDVKLPPSGQAYVDMVRRGVPEVDAKAIRDLLTRLEYPLYFLDFETAGDAIPRLPGLSPYTAYPFQYSLHTRSREGSLAHSEYLHTDRSDPRLPLAGALCRDIGPTGTLIAYNAGFEKGKIRDLADFVETGENDSAIECAGNLREMMVRFFDLLDIFRNHYSHPDFLGSNSIKSVLPVLVPTLTYENLEVSDGGQAQAAWQDAIDLDDGEEKDRVMANLREYCALDTLAMVRIYGVLLQL